MDFILFQGDIFQEGVAVYVFDEGGLGFGRDDVCERVVGSRSIHVNFDLEVWMKLERCFFILIETLQTHVVGVHVCVRWGRCGKEETRGMSIQREALYRVKLSRFYRGQWSMVNARN